MKAIGIVVVAILLIVGVALYAIMMSKVRDATKHNKATIIYALLTALCIGISGLTGFFGLTEHPGSFLLVLQLMVLIVGILHSIFLFTLVPWTSKNKFVWEFFYTLIIACISAVLLLLVFTFALKFKPLQYIMLSALTWFFVPFLFVQSYNRYLSIPARIFKKWSYPTGKDIPDPLDSELVSLVVISFEFHKKMNDPDITSFRAKAPLHMVFGRLFYYFINDYNDRHREGPIEFLMGESEPCGWVFYHKPTWYRRRKYIDADITITLNRIRENSIIVCRRTKEI
ncbi:MAG: TssN family type VI secretion system protein [Bacteroidetes bacterium]|nr:TssN family type VI secretion system protein [Bacteroidota bacterium]